MLREVGGTGQAKLRSARVLVIGAGGLGSPVLLYLAAAGVGTIGIVDFDTVSLSNLQRQIAHTTADVGRPKTDSASDAMLALNPGVSVERHALRLDGGQRLDLIARLRHRGRRIGQFRDALPGQRRVLLRQTDSGLRSGDRIRRTACDLQGARSCGPLLSLPVSRAAAARHARHPARETGVLGAAAGVMGTLQALEVIKEITGVGESMAGRLLIYEALTTRFRTVTFKPDPACPLCGSNPSIRDLSGHAKHGLTAV